MGRAICAWFTRPRIAALVICFSVVALAAPMARITPAEGATQQSPVGATRTASDGPYAAFVVSEGITQIWNTATDTLITSLSTGGLVVTPNSIVATPDGSTVFIADNANVLKVDTADDSTTTIPAGGEAVGLALEGDTLYVTHGESDSYSVVSTATETVGQPITLPGEAYGIAATGSSLYMDLVESGYVMLSLLSPGSGTPECTSTEGPGGNVLGAVGNSWPATAVGVQVASSGSEILTNSPMDNGSIWAFDSSCTTNVNVTGPFLNFAGSCATGRYGEGYALQGGDVYYVTGDELQSYPVSGFGTCSGGPTATTIATLPATVGPQSAVSVSPDGSSVWVAASSNFAGSSYAVDPSTGHVTTLLGTTNLSFGVQIAPGPQPPQPEVDSVDPNSGPVVGGTHLAVTGKRLLGAGTVKFVLTGGKVAAAKSFNCTATSCSVVTPDVSSLVTSTMGSTIKSDVEVTVSGVTSAVSAGDRFTFIRGLHVDAINPQAAGPHGGILVTITGQGFGSAGADDEIDFLPPSQHGSDWATKVEVVSDKVITATVPVESAGIDAASGSAIVKVQVGTRMSNGVDFTYGIHIDAIKPTHVGPRGGVSITIVGYGFGPVGSNDSVGFYPVHSALGLDGKDVRVISDTTIAVTVPAESASLAEAGGQVSVSVDAGGVFSNKVAFSYKIHIDSIKPTGAGLNGGTPMTITGYGFGPAGSDDTVVFSAAKRGIGTTATHVTVVSDTKITATVPAESLGIDESGGHANVFVAAGHGESNKVDFGYIFIDSIEPKTAGPNGGVPITITGYGFGPPGSNDTVSFLPSEGTAVYAKDVEVVSDTKTTAVVPAESTETAHGGGNARVSVGVGGGYSNDEPFLYKFHIDAIHAASAGRTGGVPMTITGYGFGPPGSADVVTFFPVGGGIGTLATNVTVVSDKDLTAMVPVESAGIIAKRGRAFIDVGANDVYSNRVDYSYMQ
jgi:hypothetical protein